MRRHHNSICHFRGELHQSSADASARIRSEETISSQKDPVLFSSFFSFFFPRPPARKIMDLCKTLGIFLPPCVQTAEPPGNRSRQPLSGPVSRDWCAAPTNPAPPPSPPLSFLGVRLSRHWREARRVETFSVIYLFIYLCDARRYRAFFLCRFVLSQRQQSGQGSQDFSCWGFFRLLFASRLMAVIMFVMGYRICCNSFLSPSKPWYRKGTWSEEFSENSKFPLKK